MRNTKGFTLIELMIVVAIVAILAAIAIPNYQRYILQSHRTDAINALMDLASRESRFYTRNNAYTENMLTLGYATTPTVSIGGGRYTLSASAVPTTMFTLSAVPAGAQTNDTCGTYTYTDLGVKRSAGTLSSCWKQ